MHKSGTSFEIYYLKKRFSMPYPLAMSEMQTSTSSYKADWSLQSCACKITSGRKWLTRHWISMHLSPQLYKTTPKEFVYSTKSQSMLGKLYLTLGQGIKTAMTLYPYYQLDFDQCRLADLTLGMLVRVFSDQGRATLVNITMQQTWTNKKEN